jgi:hypothetical protein
VPLALLRQFFKFMVLIDALLMMKQMNFRRWLIFFVQRVQKCKLKLAGFRMEQRTAKRMAALAKIERKVMGMYGVV